MEVEREEKQVAWIERRLPNPTPTLYLHHSQASLWLGKGLGLEILQQEGGTLAQWSRRPSCCADCGGSHSELGEQELGWSNWWEDASLLLPSPTFPYLYQPSYQPVQEDAPLLFSWAQPHFIAVLSSRIGDPLSCLLLAMWMQAPQCPFLSLFPHLYKNWVGPVDFSELFQP